MSEKPATNGDTASILVYEAVILFLKDACNVEIPGLGQFTNLQRILDGYLLSMASNNAVTAIVESVEYRKTLLELAMELGLSNDPNLRTALRIDEKRIASLLMFIFNTKSEEAAVLRLEDDSAQHFLDVVQDALDKGSLLPEEQSRMARRVIRKLSESCDRLPSSLFITGVSAREEHPTFGGGYGDIYRASYIDRPVALKRMRYFLRGSDLRRIHLKFCREALVWKDLQHPHILVFLGIDRETFPSSLCMVSPWMEHGTVMNYLQIHGHGNVDKLLYEIAQGLQYLHSCNIVHGDLRGGNILVNEDWNACLADFGLSKFSDATSSKTTNRGGSLYWMAPELIDPDRFGYDFLRTPATDVYAFGCVCLELYTGRPPFANLSEPAALIKIINGERPERPLASSPAMSALLWQNVTQFWAQNPSARPVSESVVQHMLWPAPLPSSSILVPSQLTLSSSPAPVSSTSQSPPSPAKQRKWWPVKRNVLGISLPSKLFTGGASISKNEDPQPISYQFSEGFMPHNPVISPTSTIGSPSSYSDVLSKPSPQPALHMNAPSLNNFSSSSETQQPSGHSRNKSEERRPKFGSLFRDNQNEKSKGGFWRHRVDKDRECEREEVSGDEGASPRPSSRPPSHSGRLPSRPTSLASRKRSDSIGTAGGDKRRLSVASWASSAVGSVTGRSRSKDKKTFANFTDEGKRNSEHRESDNGRSGVPTGTLHSITRRRSSSANVEDGSGVRSATARDHDSREQNRSRGRRDEENELTRKIGFLTATASEDWTLVLDICDQASATEANAKEAARALRREFKYGEPAAQLAAARLWAIMLRNSSDAFVSRSMSHKFLATLEDVLTSSHTSPVVRERLVGVLAAAAYASGPSQKEASFRGLWCRVKPDDKPEEGVPFDTEDPMFNPEKVSEDEGASPRPSSRPPSHSSRPPLRPTSRKRSDSIGTAGGDKRRLSVASWASSVVGSVTGRARSKDKETFASLTEERKRNSGHHESDNGRAAAQRLKTAASLGARRQWSVTPGNRITVGGRGDEENGLTRKIGAPSHFSRLPSRPTSRKRSDSVATAGGDRRRLSVASWASSAAASVTGRSRSKDKETFANLTDEGKRDPERRESDNGRSGVLSGTLHSITRRRSSSANVEDGIGVRGATARDHDSREQNRSRGRRDEENELTRKIGFLTATASEDWTLVLDVCDQASATEANAKEAARALRREFKYGEPAAQLAAARLWAIMLRNSSDAFVSRSMSRKFLATLEDVLTSSRTSPVVRERLMDVLAAAAYASGSKKDTGFRGLWCRIKPNDKPEEGDLECVLLTGKGLPDLMTPVPTSEDAARGPRDLEHPRCQSPWKNDSRIFSPQTTEQVVEALKVTDDGTLVGLALAFTVLVLVFTMPINVRPRFTLKIARDPFGRHGARCGKVMIDSTSAI
ncbi:Kinase-like protein [Mycena venus]|uniref:Kinase-like protein n=1 Tax=Mycena venus TaxID=2733690 RepID=A0A8H7D2M4_9AGAR|nr:Kinase-like protein [Mycena venus]